jgi:hypothetical protein
VAWHFAASKGWANERYDCDSCRKRTGTRVRPDRPNCRKYFPDDYDTLSEEAWWSATYRTDKGDSYYPDDFRWPECPVSALTHERGHFDPIGLIQIITEARNTGGKGAAFAITKRDARMYDAAAVVEQCRNAEHAAASKAMHEHR